MKSAPLTLSSKKVSPIYASETDFMLDKKYPTYPSGNNSVFFISGCTIPIS
jgi:hypothetical protein